MSFYEFAVKHEGSRDCILLTGGSFKGIQKFVLYEAHKKLWNENKIMSQRIEDLEVRLKALQADKTHEE